MTETQQRRNGWNAGHGVLARAARAIVGVVLFTSGSAGVAQQPVVAAHAPANASANELLARRVTIHLKHVSLPKAIDSVSRVAKVFVEFQLSLLETHSALVTLDVTNKPLGIVLEQVLSGTGLRVVPGAQESLTIVAAPDVDADSVPSFGNVSGYVVDSATGRGVPGATIKVAGTKFAAITDDSGQFVVRNVPAGTQLVTARMYGYRPAERTVQVTPVQKARVRIIIASIPTILSGVVTTATGTQRKIEVGNDITTLNADSILRVAPVTSITDLLETRVPGLTVQHSSGTPGDPSRIRIRGAGSIQGNNDPIVIVDGVRVYAAQSDPRNQNLAPGKGTSSTAAASVVYAAPSPLDQIDPNSIETIEVLKGPSATAIYGSDAAAGVIVITSKRGKAGPAHWSVVLGDGVSWLPGDWPTNYFRFGYDDLNAGPFCNWYEVSCQVDSTVAFQALNDPRYTLFTHGGSQQVSTTVSGGTPALTYSATGSVARTNGYLELPGSEVQRYDSLYGQISNALVHPDRYKTWSVGGQLTASPVPTVRVTLQSMLFNSTQQRSALDNAISQLAGVYISPATLTGPLITREYERATSDAVTSTNAITAHWQPLQWLPLDATGGVNTMQQNSTTYVPFGVYDDVGTLANCSGSCGDTTGSYGLGRGTSRVKTLTVHTAVPVLQRVTLSAGGQYNSTATTDFSVYTNQLAPGVTTPTTFVQRDGCTGSTAVCYSQATQATSDQSTYGWFLEPRLNVASRFFAAPGFQLSGGSGGNKGSGLNGLTAFPKMDFSYIAVDRQRDSPLGGFLTLLRPRVAFGYAGTQPSADRKLRLYNIGSYADNATIGGSTTAGSGLCKPLLGTLDGVSTVPAVCLQSLGNTQLHPERSVELEGGFEATLWQGRLSLDVTESRKTRHDAIISIPVAPSVFSNDYGDLFSIDKNIGVIRNTSTEIQATATVLQNQALGWTIGTSVSKNNSVVVRLNPGQNPIVTNGLSGLVSNTIETRVQAGYPLFAVFARPILGVVDANANGIAEPNEIRYGDSLVYIGRPDPNYEITMTHDVSLFRGRLNAHFNFDYQNGLTQYNAGACGSQSFALLPNTPGTSLATQAAVTAACGLGPISQAKSIIGLVQVVNTFRFSSFSVDYEVPRWLASRVSVPRLSVALQGSNLALHTNYRGKDPNVNAFSTAGRGDQTEDRGQIPLPRTFTLRITMGN